MTELEEAANTLAGVFWRLERYGYIQTFDEAEEGQCAHWKAIGHEAMEEVRRLLPSLNTGCHHD